MKRRLLVFSVVLLLSLFYQLPTACYAAFAGSWTVQDQGLVPSKTTSEEAAFFSSAKACPLNFNLSGSKVAAAWGRAQSWIGQNSSMKIQTVTNYLIATYSPQFTQEQYGYTVSKSPLDDGTFDIQVECKTGDINRLGDSSHAWTGQRLAEINAHLLAYYIKTGKKLGKQFISSQ